MPSSDARGAERESWEEADYIRMHSCTHALVHSAHRVGRVGGMCLAPVLSSSDPMVPWSTLTNQVVTLPSSSKEGGGWKGGKIRKIQNLALYLELGIGKCTNEVCQG